MLRKGLEVPVGNKTTSSPSVIAACFNKFFAKIGSTVNGLVSSTPPSVDHDNSPPPFEFKHIEISSICKQLKGLQTKKATGLDNIPNRLLKLAAESIAPSLTFIFILSISSGIL